MYENIVGISIKGRCFSDTKKMQFFPAETDRMSIVYGKNGSGKSTLTEGFSQAVNDLEENDLEVALIDREDNNVVITDIQKKNLYVFNESYIDTNIRICEDGLNTIVLFGEQLDVENQIKDINKKIKKAEEEKVKITEEYGKYIDKKSIVSPDFYYDKIKKILKVEGGWAEKDAKIKNNKHNSAVSDRLIAEICELNVTETIAELEEKFKETQCLLDKVSDNNISFPDMIAKKDEIEKEENEIVLLLNKKIEKPLLTKREKVIMSAIENGFQSRVEETKKMFEDEDIEICPYCYQVLSSSYKQQMLESIQKVLNKDVELHTAKLNNIFMKEYVFDNLKYCELDAKLAEDIGKQIQKCNDIINEYNKNIKNKIENIYTPIDLKVLGLNDNVIILNELIEQLECKRKEFNSVSKQVEKIKISLADINKKIAHESIKDDYKVYKKQVKEKEIINGKLQQKDVEIAQYKNHLLRLEETKKNVAIAIKQINKSLEYVFFSKERLFIELKNDLYYLKSNGKYVKPRDVSCGERNIIALCYFFTQIMSNLEVEKLYSIEQYIVIDDPVSSFDFENKIGIISFLKKQIRDVIMGNNSSKVLIFSHDLTTIFDLQKAAEEVGKLTQKTAGVKNTTFAWFEIKEGKLEKFTKKRSEYTELIKLVYGYAKDKSGIDSINIGNTMRRVLEAFSTFNYKKSIQEISCDIEIMKDVPNKEYFENLMYRLVLHNESHYEEQIQNFHDGINFYDFISEEEKQKTAKEILCLIYLLNPMHIKSHLPGTAVNDIVQWGANLA